MKSQLVSVGPGDFILSFKHVVDWPDFLMYDIWEIPFLVYCVRGKKSPVLLMNIACLLYVASMPSEDGHYVYVESMPSEDGHYM